MDKTDRIFVSGHKGMVGSAILNQFREEGFQNIVTRSHEELDLIDQKEVRTFFKNKTIDHVVLAAARVGGIYANNTYPAEFIYQNLMIQTNVIHEACCAGVKQLLFLGSSCIYPRNCPQPMSETHLLTGPLEKTNEPYAIAKIAGIKMCEAYNRQYGTQYRALMPTNLYGPNDNYDLENCHVLPALIRKFHLAKLALDGEWHAIDQDEKLFGPIPDDIKASLNIARNPEESASSLKKDIQVALWGTGAPFREFLYVNDLAAAALFIMRIDDGAYKRALKEGGNAQNSKTPENSNNVFINIGTGKDITIKELAELVAEVVGYKGQIKWDPSKPDGTPRKLMNTNVISSLGWQPKISLKTGIELTYQDYLSKYSYS